MRGGCGVVVVVVVVMVVVACVGIHDAPVDWNQWLNVTAFGPVRIMASVCGIQ
jgi:hypothetical protein